MRNAVASRAQRVHLWITNHYGLLRGILVGLIVFLVFIFNVTMLMRQSEQTLIIKGLSEQNKELNTTAKRLALRTNELSEENQVLAKQNRAYTFCGFSLFAKYTRDQMPITDLNLDTCSVGNQDDLQTNAPTPTTRTSPSTTPPEAPIQTQGKPAPKAQDNPGWLQRILKALGR